MVDTDWDRHNYLARLVDDLNGPIEPLVNYLETNFHPTTALVCGYRYQAYLRGREGVLPAAEQARVRALYQVVKLLLLYRDDPAWVALWLHERSAEGRSRVHILRESTRGLDPQIMAEINELLDEAEE